MKTSARFRPSGSQRGIASVIVLVVLTVLLLLVLGNTVALHHLKREIQRVEKLQLRKLESPPVVRPAAEVEQEPVGTEL